MMEQERFVDRDTWLKGRKRLLNDEKALNAQRESLNIARRSLGYVRIEKAYTFETIAGEAALGDLFGDKSQLIIYHFMFGADWDEGCPSCSFWMDNFNGIDAHLAARDTAFACVSTAALDKLTAYKERMGWTFNWVSSGISDFNADFGVTFRDGKPGPTGGYNYTDGVHTEEAPGLSVFRKFERGSIGHAYSTYARGLDVLNGAYHLLDLTPLGRNEEKLPWPQAWIRRRDEYEI